MKTMGRIAIIIEKRGRISDYKRRRETQAHINREQGSKNESHRRTTNI